jgi:NAD+ kinase
VVVGDQRDIRPHVTCDGQTHQVTTVDDEIIVRKKPEHLCLIHPTDHDFYDICRNKLGWASHAGNGSY